MHRNEIETDKEIIYYSLTMRKNYIQTGDPFKSPEDVENCGEGKIKPLSTDQMKLVIRIQELMNRCLNNKNNKTKLTS